MAETTLVFEQAAGAWYVTSDDPKVPVAYVEMGQALCPRCGARIRLEERTREGDNTAWVGRLTGLEYQLHYAGEHLARPRRRVP